MIEKNNVSIIIETKSVALSSKRNKSKMIIFDKNVRFFREKEYLMR